MPFIHKPASNQCTKQKDWPRRTYLWLCSSLVSTSLTLSTICWIFFDKLALCSSICSNIISRYLLYVADRFFSMANCWDNSLILSCSFCKKYYTKEKLHMGSITQNVVSLGIIYGNSKETNDYLKSEFMYRFLVNSTMIWILYGVDMIFGWCLHQESIFMTAMRADTTFPTSLISVAKTMKWLFSVRMNQEEGNI